MTADFAHCRRIVETQDRDRALSLAFAPKAKRDALCALFAFDCETGRIRELVSEPMPGEIRLQWWRDAIAASGEEAGSASGEAAGHPVAAALDETIRRHGLPRDAFDRLLDARIFDLYDDPMPSREAFEAYAGETASALIVLAARILAPEDATGIADAAGHAGVALTVVEALRRLPAHRARGQTYFPGDLLSAAGCSSEDLAHARPEPIGRAIAAMTAFGLEHADAFGQRLPALPRSVRPAFLPATTSAVLLRRASQAGVAVAERPVVLAPLRKTIAYWGGMRA